MLPDCCLTGARPGTMIRFTWPRIRGTIGPAPL